MKITLVSQASVIIETSDCRIWTDPWLFGTAFMESWSLLPAASWNDTMYDRINYLWISHEHPDHFHLPTLKSMPAEFKNRVIVLYQKNNSNKMSEAFSRLGFKNITLLPHRKIIALTKETKVYCCQIGGTPDSSLGVMNNGYTLLNVNDCEANSRDCKIFAKDIGKIDVLLNQFSIAGYRGDFDYKTQLTRGADIVLKNMIQNHKDLHAGTTIPIASFTYFSDVDNRYINDFMNTPADVKRIFDEHQLSTAILFPGDTFISDKIYNSESALVKYDNLYQNLIQLQYRTPAVIELEKLKIAFETRHHQLKEKYPKWLMNKLKPLVFRIKDLDISLRVCLRDGSFEETDEDVFDIILGSEAFHYAFANRWGMSTISIAAKYLIKSNKDIWKWYKIINTLNNSEIYLKPRFLFSKNNFDFLLARLDGGLNQILYKWKRMET